MSKKYFTYALLPLIIASSSAKEVVECKAVTGLVSKCNPYSYNFLVAKEVEYQKDKKKLIKAKTLPVPKRDTSNIVSVVDMIEKYVKIEKPVRYEGSQKRELQSLNIESEEDDYRYSLSREMDIRRESTLKKLLQMQIDSYKNISKSSKLTKSEGNYTIVKGDSLSTIAEIFSMKTVELRDMNKLAKGSTIKIGDKLTIPMKQNRIDVIANSEYIVQFGDNIGSIAKDFNISSLDIKKYNKLNKNSTIYIGKKLIMPFSHTIAKLKKDKTKKIFKRSKRTKRPKMLKGFKNKKLRVTATAYSSHKSQTDSTPFLAAWNNRLRPGMKIIAVSRDLLTKYGLKNGSKVKIGGLPGYYRVRDKMNKRYKKRIDIYMGMNRRKALRWGKRSVLLYY